MKNWQRAAGIFGVPAVAALVAFGLGEIDAEQLIISLASVALVVMIGFLAVDFLQARRERMDLKSRAPEDKMTIDEIIQLVEDWSVDAFPDDRANIDPRKSRVFTMPLRDNWRDMRFEMHAVLFFGAADVLSMVTIHGKEREIKTFQPVDSEAMKRKPFDYCDYTQRLLDENRMSRGSVQEAAQWKSLENGRQLNTNQFFSHNGQDPFQNQPGGSRSPGPQPDVRDDNSGENDGESQGDRS